MVFCYIPAGEAQLGSPKAEREAVLKYLGVMDVPQWLAAEAEEKRGKYTSKGFWLGKYEVTQKEWKAVEGSNPSEFDGERDNKAKDLDTTHFPVETVSWNDCKGFANALNKRADAAKVFGKGSRICLPDENEWEYAYRGGKGNGRAFYWGDTLDGSQANCSGPAYGTDKKGTYLDRPCSVTFTNDGEYEAHPWGLMHMSGNVAEWCDSEFSKGRYIPRGCSWQGAAVFCRGADRNGYDPKDATAGSGLRLCIRYEWHNDSANQCGGTRCRGTNGDAPAVTGAGRASGPQPNPVPLGFVLRLGLSRPHIATPER